MTVKIEILSPRFLLSLAFSLTIVSSINISHANEKILTNTWPPYINPAGQPLGSAADILEIVFRRSNLKKDWQYVPYELAFFEVQQGNQLLSYPYFKTKARQDQVLFSDPIFTVSSRVFYNRQFINQHQARQQFAKQQRIGKVAGYSYGESLDAATAQATIYSNEKRALRALFNREIDLLPMTESVMNAILSSDFNDQQQLIRPLKDVKDISSLHLIAAKTSAGQAVIERVNLALAALTEAGLASIKSEPFDAPAQVDIARLITAEGYPTILGQTSVDAHNTQFYTLPQGTTALVMQWNKNMLMPSNNDRLYQHMMDLSKVVILNGPHVGKELYVRNMHIELR